MKLAWYILVLLLALGKLMGDTDISWWTLAVLAAAPYLFAAAVVLGAALLLGLARLLVRPR